MDQCFAGNQLACGFITRDAAGNISALTAYPINLSTLVTNGVDVELSYRVPFADTTNSLSLRSIISYVGKLATTTPGSPSIDRAGEVGINSNPVSYTHLRAHET